MLVLTRKKGESILINDNVEITVLEVLDGKIKIGIEAPKSVKILRKEVIDITMQENKEAQTGKLDIDKLKSISNLKI